MLQALGATQASQVPYTSLHSSWNPCPVFLVLLTASRQLAYEYLVKRIGGTTGVYGILHSSRW